MVWFAVVACGPDKRPPEGCDGPSFNLVVSAEDAPLPRDTRINVLYGSNQDGEPYALGQQARGQAVFCEEDTVQGGGPSDIPEPSAGVGGAAGGASAERTPSDDEAGGHGPDVWALRCRLYTQGPARVDVTATGYEPIEDQALLFGDDDRCNAPALVVLVPLAPEMDE